MTQPEDNGQDKPTLSEEINLRAKAKEKRADTATLATANTQNLDFKL